MTRWLGILILALWLPLAVSAQGTPQLTVDLPEGDVVLGQPLTLRLKLLVPSWMPKPPVWPTLEVPSLLVRLPERASTAISETIEGETWSGISRAYRLYPLELGNYEIPAQQLIVTYADPGKPDPIVAELMLDPIRFRATLPQGAQGLEPPIVANGLTLEQQIDGESDLRVGDAITRTVTVAISGTTPVLLPALMPALAPVSGSDPAPLRAYPKEPVVSETEQRGVLSGGRVEITTYVAQAGGAAELPAITLEWFNLESGKLETATLAATNLQITAPPPTPPSPADYARWVAWAVGALALIWGIGRLISPYLRAGLAWAISAWTTSEKYAARAAIRTIRAGNLGDTYVAIDRWARFFPLMTQDDLHPLYSSLAQIGRTDYGSAPAPKSQRNTVSVAFGQLRKSQRSGARRGRTQVSLPPLNP